MFVAAETVATGPWNVGVRSGWDIFIAFTFISFIFIIANVARDPSCEKERTHDDASNRSVRRTFARSGRN